MIWFLIAVVVVASALLGLGLCMAAARGDEREEP